MDTLKIILSFIMGTILAVLIMNLIEDIVPNEGIAQLFLALAIFGVSIFLVITIVDSLFKDSKKKNDEQKEKPVDQSQLKNKDDLKSLCVTDYNLVTSVFYEFCFDSYYSNVILDSQEISYHLRQIMNEYNTQKDAVSLILFSRKAKSKGIIIKVNDSVHQQHNSFKFTLKAERITLNNPNNYLEVLSNDFGESTEDNLPMSVATRYIIHFENDQPVFIYVVVKTFLLNSFTLRKVNANGSSSNMGRLQNDDLQTITKFLNNKLNKSK
ncbi:hypothetical protein [uncultured Nonlabens sp.]|uniref:hypothetical protein n=1 Tax=uncultured Nonlabens sp. TaxID=859306 RepID=UPI00261038FE|nr:hypothetical protein [uncultured Nonlabens sp.]